VAEKVDGQWRVNQWLKKAVLELQCLNWMEARAAGRSALGQSAVKVLRLTADSFAKAGRRRPWAIVRRGAFVAPGVLMPAVNLGPMSARIDDRHLGDGRSRADRRNVHISAAPARGVLEPLWPPVIIEDGSSVPVGSGRRGGRRGRRRPVDGRVPWRSTKIADRASGEVMYGRVPAYSVVVPGTLPVKQGQGRKFGPRLRDRQAGR
jgi:2,3,4,5-tetrahydropyridine-2-carboxylate N-succinyltransferase